MAKDADGWFTPGRFALVLAGLIAATFSGILFGQETFWFRDFGQFGYPLAHYQRECFWRGELPFWNPLNSCGLPFLAQWNTLTLYPPALFYLIFPLSWSLGVFNLAHLWLAGMGMYFLANRWVANRLAASVAGVAFAFNGLTWHSLMWPNDIAALGWMPWVVLTVEQAWNAAPVFDVQRSMFDVRCYFKSCRPIVLAAFFGTMQMLAGAPEIILLTWSLLGILWIAEFATGSVPRFFLLARFVTVVLLIAGLAAVQLLPFLELLTHSHRSGGLVQTLDWAMPLSGPANFLVPQFHCFASLQGVFVQHDQYWTASHYIGIGATALAIVGVCCVRNSRVWLLLGVTLISIWMALGAPAHLYPVARKIIPVLALMRYSIKFVVLAVFVIPLLAAYGVKWHQSRVNAGESLNAKRAVKNIALVLIGLIAVILLIAWKFPREMDDLTTTCRGAICRVVFLILALTALVYANRVGEFRMRVLLRIALLALLWADVYTHAPNLNPTVRRSIYETGLIRQALHLAPQASPGEPRFMETQDAMDEVGHRNLPDPQDDYLCRRLALSGDCNLLDDIPTLDGFYSLFLRESSQTLALVCDADGNHINVNGLKDFLGIGYISAPQTNHAKMLDWTPRPMFMPLITAGQQPLFTAETNRAAALLAPDFEPRRIVFLPPEARNEVKAARTDAKIISTNLSWQRMQMEVEAPAPAMVVAAQSFYSAWHAYVDGQRVKLWPANFGFQALEIPAGRHTVKLVYEDAMFKAGAVISSATLAMLLLIWFHKRRRA